MFNLGIYETSIVTKINIILKQCCVKHKLQLRALNLIILIILSIIHNFLDRENLTI